MVFDEDDKLWADLEQLTLESGTASLSTPTEFHRFSDLPVELLVIVVGHMEFDSLMKLRGVNKTMKALVESTIYQFEYVKCTHWMTHHDELHFHVMTRRQGKELDLTLENELFDHDYGFVPYNHVLQFVQQVLKYGRTKVLDICYVPQHGLFERIDEIMTDFLEQLESSAPFRFTNFILDGISPPIASFFLNNSEECVETIQLYHDGPTDSTGTSVDLTELINEEKFQQVSLIKMMCLSDESYSRTAISMAQKWMETDSDVGQKVLIAKCEPTEQSEKVSLFHCFGLEFGAEIISHWENKDDEKGEIRIQMSDVKKQILVTRVEVAVFLVIIPSSLRGLEISKKFRKEIEWLQQPMLDESF